MQVNIVRVFEYYIVFAPCILIPLGNITNERHIFQINALIRMLTFSTCFETHEFITRKRVCTRRLCMVCFFMYVCKQYSRWTL